MADEKLIKSETLVQDIVNALKNQKIDGDKLTEFIDHISKHNEIYNTNRTALLSTQKNIDTLESLYNKLRKKFTTQTTKISVDYKSAMNRLQEPTATLNKIAKGAGIAAIGAAAGVAGGAYGSTWYNAMKEDALVKGELEELQTAEIVEMNSYMEGCPEDCAEFGRKVKLLPELKAVIYKSDFLQALIRQWKQELNEKENWVLSTEDVRLQCCNEVSTDSEVRLKMMRLYEYKINEKSMGVRSWSTNELLAGLALRWAFLRMTHIQRISLTSATSILSGLGFNENIVKDTIVDIISQEQKETSDDYDMSFLATDKIDLPSDSSEQPDGESEQSDGESEQSDGESEQSDGESEQSDDDSQQSDDDSEQSDDDSQQSDGDSASDMVSNEKIEQPTAEVGGGRMYVTKKKRPSPKKTNQAKRASKKNKQAKTSSKETKQAKTSSKEKNKRRQHLRSNQKNDKIVNNKN